MKTLKNLMKMTLITLCMINAACNNAQNPENGFNNSNYNASFSRGSSNHSNNQDLKLHPSIHPKSGMIECHIPLPRDWKVDYTTWSGPKGQTVKFLGTGNVGNGQQRPMSMEQVIDQMIKPKMFSNYRIDRVIPLKDVAMKDSQVQAKFYKYAPSNDLSQVTGLETTNVDNGDRALLVVHYLVVQSQYGSFGSYRVHLLETKARDYDQSKAIFINALSTYQENDQMIAMHNQQEQAKLAANDRAFQSRMRSKEAQFQASQNTYKTYSDISDMSHRGYMERSKVNDYGHSRGVDATLGQETTYNPYDGNEVNMESGYDNYYMNTWGEYIGTNDQFYDPNMDSNINNQEWRKVDPR